ncbi:MAG: hypothetical protein AAFP09_01030 [Cyanobacteria bacterium J06607_10]
MTEKLTKHASEELLVKALQRLESGAYKNEKDFIEEAFNKIREEDPRYLRKAEFFLMAVSVPLERMPEFCVCIALEKLVQNYEQMMIDME